LTINFTLCFITILGGLSLGHPPLNVIQMLWVNLIMDVLGAIALGTEPYNEDSNNKSKRISRREKIMMPQMWRQVIIQSAYQIFVMMILMYLGGLIFFDETVNLIRTPLRNLDGSGTDRLKLDTICFHTFILMNMFNMINCRSVEPYDINVFKTLLNNKFFWFIFIGEIVVQQFMIYGGGSSILSSVLLGTAELSVPMQITCWCLGAFSLVVNIVLKQIPIDRFEELCPNLEGEGSDKLGNVIAKAREGYNKRVQDVISAGA